MAAPMSDGRLNEIVRSYDDKLQLRPKQLEALLHLGHRKGDLIVNLPVGYGKSIIFHLLPQLLGGVVIVISPLNIIQKDQRNNLKSHNISYCRLDITGKVDSEDVLGSDNDDGDETTSETYSCEADVSIENIKRGHYSVVLSHPEALLNTKRGKELLKSELQDHVVAIVIDECHILEKWGDEFRTAFKELKNLRAFFPSVPVVALSGTLTCKQKSVLPNQLNLNDHTLIEASPDRTNLFLEKIDKGSTSDVESEYEGVTHALCDRLYVERELFPVTLLFLPVHYMSQAIMYLNNLFNPKNIDDAIFSAICSGQDPYVIDKTMTELKRENPQIRLVLTTSILGMGFVPENVTNVVHACPPRNVSQYFQEIGRAGRRGQQAHATLYYRSRNIAKNLPGINDDIISYCRNNTRCLRNELLSVFGFEKSISITGCKCCSFCKQNCICEECFPLNVEQNAK